MTKRTATELWDALENETMDSEIETVLAMTPEERRRELVAAGVDLDALHKEAEAFFLKMASSASAASSASSASSAPAATAPSPAAPSPAASPAASAPPAVVLRPRWKRVTVLVPAVVALAAGVALVIQLVSPPPSLTARRPIDPARAAVLRNEARDACNAKNWQTCTDKLFEAEMFDPQGDRAPEVQALWHTAAEGERHP